MASIELRAENQRSLAFGSIVAGYSVIQSAIAKPLRIVKVDNLTDALLQFSFDGINDHFVIPANGFMLIDITTNDIADEGFFISKGSNISVKRIGTPTTGSVYLTTMYARGS